MHLTGLATDVIGAVTISLVSLTAIVGLLCIYRSVYFQLRIQRRGSLQLSYFNGPWIIRIALILVTIWWGFGEIARLTFLNDRRSFLNPAWKIDICKFYVVSNMGFAEPTIFVMLAFLLHAALQRSEVGTLSQRWNSKTFAYTILCCLPIFVLQVMLILYGHKIKMAKFFTRTYFSTEGNRICTYPLLSSIFLCAFDSLLIIYVLYIGARLLSLVINKGLRRRVYFLIFAVTFFLPLRVFLLGFSVVLVPGHLLLYEAIVFLAFLMLLFCSTVGICMLVYLPLADSMALIDLGHIEMEGIHYDDHYSDGASLIANWSHQGETGNNSEASTKRSSISFQILVKDEPRAFDGIVLP